MDTIVFTEMNVYQFLMTISICAVYMYICMYVYVCMNCLPKKFCLFVLRHRMVKLGGLDSRGDISIRSEHSRNARGKFGVIADSIGLLLGVHSYHRPVDSGALLLLQLLLYLGHHLQAPVDGLFLREHSKNLLRAKQRCKYAL